MRNRILILVVVLPAILLVFCFLSAKQVPALRQYLANAQNAIWRHQSLSTASSGRSLVTAPPERPVVDVSHLPSAPLLTTEGSVNGVMIQKAATPIQARITIRTGTYRCMPNSIGIYPPISVAPDATAHVQLSLEPNETVSIQAIDGGQLKDKMAVSEQRADSTGIVNFDFRVSTEPGNYRVAVYANGKRQFLSFLVDSKLANSVNLRNQSL